MTDEAHSDRLIAENIDTVVRLESAALRQRTAADRAADAIAAFVGSVGFVTIHVVGFAAWAAINLGLLRFVPPFDPYPFSLLSMIMSTEGVLLAAFVLIKQNRLGYLSDRRAHLDLQVNLLTEHEVTRLLQLTERIASRVGVPASERQSGALAEETEVEHLIGALDRKLTGDR